MVILCDPSGSRTHQARLDLPSMCSDPVVIRPLPILYHKLNSLSKQKRE